MLLALMAALPVGTAADDLLDTNYDGNADSNVDGDGARIVAGSAGVMHRIDSDTPFALTAGATWREDSNTTARAGVAGSSEAGAGAGAAARVRRKQVIADQPVYLGRSHR